MVYKIEENNNNNLQYTISFGGECDFMDVGVDGVLDCNNVHKCHNFFFKMVFFPTKLYQYLNYSYSYITPSIVSNVQCRVSPLSGITCMFE